MLESSTETKIGDHHHYPGDEPGDGGDINEPVEDFRARVRDIEVSEECKGPGEEHRDVRNPAAVGGAEDLWGLLVESHGLENSRTRVDKRVSCRPSRCQNCDIDYMVQDWDPSSLDSEDKRACARVRSSE